MPRRWHQPATMLRIARGRWQQGPFTGESTKEAVKTIAQGMPGCSGAPVVNCSCAFYFACEAMGAAGVRPSLPPLLSLRAAVQRLGRIRAAGMRRRVLVASCERSEAIRHFAQEARLLCR